MYGRLAIVGIWMMTQSWSAFAESTRYFQIEGFGALLNGEPESVALDQHGRIGLPPEAREIWLKPESMITAATLWRGGVAMAPRHRRGATTRKNGKKRCENRAK